MIIDGYDPWNSNDFWMTEEEKEELMGQETMADSSGKYTPIFTPDICKEIVAALDNFINDVKGEKA